MYKPLKVIIVTILLILVLPLKPVYARDKAIKAKVLEVQSANSEQKTYILQVENNNKIIKVTVNKDESPYVFALSIRKDMTVFIQEEGENLYAITGLDRTTQLFYLIIIFIFLTILISGMQGVKAIIGLITTYFILFAFFIPQIIQGRSPITMSIISGFFVILISLYISHGFNKRVTAAVTGTFIAFLLSLFFSVIIVKFMHLTGYTSEELIFLMGDTNKSLDIKGILIASLLIGTLGSLDDVTISQADITYTLMQHDKKISLKTLYKKAMLLGKNHISSMINTLLITYTSANLALILLLSANQVNFMDVLNIEVIAEDIVRAISTSTILLLAVPLTTVISYFFYKDNR